MKIKFIIAALFFVVFTSSAGAAFDPCAKDYTPIAQRYTNGIAFLVQKCGGAQNVIVGTMHSDSPDIVKLHENGIEVMKVAKNALFEVKFDNNAMLAALKTMYFPSDGSKTLKDVVGEKYFSKFEELINNDDPKNEKLKPWSAAVLLQYPKNVADGVELDLKLQKMAGEAGVKVAGLETIDEQLSIFNDIPEDEQVEMLKDVIDNYDANMKIQDEMVKDYLAKDLTGLEGLIPESLKLSTDPEKAKALLKKLIDDRNIKMADRAVPYFETGNAFIAVGALHLPGKAGLLKLFEDKGYKVETLY